jgi:hypothetical protein
LQLTTVRFLGTFLADPLAVPPPVLQCVARQLDIQDTDGIAQYRAGEQRWDHVTKIRACYGYSDIAEPRVGFRLGRWLYGLCWTGTERPSVLFERAVGWLLAHKVLLPGPKHPGAVCPPNTHPRRRTGYGAAWRSGWPRSSGRS